MSYVLFYPQEDRQFPRQQDQEFLDGILSPAVGSDRFHAVRSKSENTCLRHKDQWVTSHTNLGKSGSIVHARNFIYHNGAPADGQLE